MIDHATTSILIAFGAHQVIGRSTLLAPLRERVPDGVRAWMECPLCSGWWYAIAYGFASVAWLDAPWITAVVTPWCGAGGALFLAELLDLIVEARTWLTTNSKENSDPS